MASVSAFSSPSCSVMSLGLRMRSRNQELGYPGFCGPQTCRSRSPFAKRSPLSSSFCGGSKGLARPRGRKIGVVMCSTSDEEDDEDRSDVTGELLAARKKRALYATKLLIETPLMGLCALTLLTAWAHWAPAARASGAPLDVYALTNDLFIKGDIELLDFYAITPAWGGVYMLFRRCTDDVSELVSAVYESGQLRKALPSDQTEPSLDWDSDDDDAAMRFQYWKLKADAQGAVIIVTFLLLPWVACNFIFPPTGDYDIWLRHMYLSLPVVSISSVVSQTCTCLALEARKWATTKRRS